MVGAWRLLTPTLKLYPGSSRALSPLQELLQTQSFKKRTNSLLPQRSCQLLNDIFTNTAKMSEANIYDEIEIEVRSPRLFRVAKRFFADMPTIQGHDLR